MSGLPFSNGRRRLLRAVGAGVLATWAPAYAADGASPRKILFGTTAVFLDNQMRLLAKWRTRLEEQLGMEVHFVQRGSYGEITEMLLADQLDVAWVCGYPYVTHADRMKLLVVPQYQGKPLYRSYLVVPASDASTTSIVNLRNRVFAYSDPQSNSGCLIPRTELIRDGIDPRRFFSKTFFTYAHRKVVDAVASGLAAAGEIDGYIFDTLAKQAPEAVTGIRVAWKSPLYGFPPIVARRSLSMETFAPLQVALLGMAEDPVGRDLLNRLNLDRFVIAPDALFDDIRNLVKLSDTMPV
ncbi:phosphonate ABC transporter, periplasmic phosphonate-binding protein [Caballeronia peredens]|nr:phosphonate ABC transporter, periplasmic phosphonate-binding protein [Caballeronia peredens]